MPEIETSAKNNNDRVGPASGMRITSLDGLRGIAAFVVLLSHFLTLFPIISEPIADSYEVPDKGSLAWFLIHTPLHFLFEGAGAVMVFFVLSGFVLTLPVLRSDSFAWRSYYPQRIVRLYLPVIASVILTVALILISPRGQSFDREVDHDRPTTVTAMAVVKDLTLLAGTGYLNPPLWSLRWEVIFSLLLPLFIWVALKFRTRPMMLVLVSVFCVFIGEIVLKGPLIFLPMFMVGVAFACGWERMTSIAQWIDNRKQATSMWALLLVLGVVTLEGYWYVVLLDLSAPLERAGAVLTLIGAIIIVFVAANAPAFKRFLNSRPAQWLGKVSFSLYLIHEPIILAFAYAMPLSLTPLVILITLPLSLVAAHFFYLWVEKPSYTLAHKVRRAFAPVRLGNKSSDANS